MKADDAIAKLSKKLYRDFHLRYDHLHDVTSYTRRALADAKRQQIYVSSAERDCGVRGKRILTSRGIETSAWTDEWLDYALPYFRSFRDGMEEQDFWKTKLEYAESVSKHTSRNQAWVEDGCWNPEWLKDAHQEWLKNRDESYNPYDYDYDLDSCPSQENYGCRDTQEIVSVAPVDDNIVDDALDLFLAQFKITAEKE